MSAPGPARPAESPWWGYGVALLAGACLAGFLALVVPAIVRGLR